MLSSVLQNKITYYIMYPDKDLFPPPPKIFGSLCFIHNHNPHMTKLDSRSPRGIFLSYSRTQKGYKHFCPYTGNVLLSGVTFLESKLKIFTSYSPLVSEDNYNYLFYHETLINSDRSTSENVTGKNPL